MNPIVQARMMALKAAARRAGIPFTITSTDRSSTQQARLYQAWLARGKTGLPAAPPGRSTHEYGYAFDASYPDSRRREVVALAAQVGLVWFGPADKVHFDPFGPKRWNELLGL